MRLIAVAVVLSICIGCNRAASEASKDVLDIHYVESADAVKDSQQCFEARDLRFVALDGMARTYPGLGGDTQLLAESFGTKSIGGTSDLTTNYSEERLRAIARVYAAAYNRHLLAKLVDSNIVKTSTTGPISAQ